MSELGRARLVRHGFVVDCGVEIRTGSNRIELFGQISDSDLLVFRLLVTKFDFECRLAGGKSFDINNAQDSNRVGKPRNLQPEANRTELFGQISDRLHRFDSLPVGRGSRERDQLVCDLSEGRGSIASGPEPATCRNDGMQRPAGREGVALKSSFE